MRTHVTETTNIHDPMAAWRACGGAAPVEAAGARPDAAGADDGLAAGRWSQTSITCGIADEGLWASIYTRGVYNTCGFAG
ncbi:hypothetical protein [Shumkonia mesophila]|uniref:hypothetical protein n=1 Tax=Shumkonia mesophila TaxID=2838854 RepID=UPI002934C90C|nr:hypothetical protein [Shumkonia mesophila]